MNLYYLAFSLVWKRKADTERDGCGNGIQLWR